MLARPEQSQPTLPGGEDLMVNSLSTDSFGISTTYHPVETLPVKDGSVFLLLRLKC